MNILLIVLITVWVSFIVPKPWMFHTAIIGAFLGVGGAICEISSTAGSNLIAIVICAICLGVPVYRLYH